MVNKFCCASRRRRRRRRLPIELIQGSLDLRLIIVSCFHQQQQIEVNRRCNCRSRRMFSRMLVNRHDEIASDHVDG